MTLFFNTFVPFFVIATILDYLFRYQFLFTDTWHYVRFSIVFLLLGLILAKFFVYKIKFKIEYLLIYLYILLLCFYTSIRSDQPVFVFLYGFKDYMIPFFLMLVYVGMNDADRNILLLKIIYSIAFSGFIVSTFYLTELYYYNTDNTLFLYNDGLKDLLSNDNNRVDVNRITGFENSDGDKFIRLPGLLGHVNATALVIAWGLGAQIFLLMKQNNLKLLYFFLIVISLLGVVLVGSRTIWFAIVGSLIILLPLRSFFLPIIGLYFVFLIIGYYVPALQESLSLSRLYGATSAILSKSELLSIYNFFNIIIGYGFTYPGFIELQKNNFAPIVDDDLFILQLFTGFGGFFLLVFFSIIYFSLLKIKRHKDSLFFYFFGFLVFVSLISTIHTSSLIRNQIFPVFLLIIGGLISYSKSKNTKTLKN